MFAHFPNYAKPREVEKPFFRDGAPCIIDGLDVLEALCPVSEKTGLRENFLSLIRKLTGDPAKQNLLYQCLQELPVDNSQQGLDEDSKFDMCPQRLEIGTPAENQVLFDHWASIVDLYKDSQKAQAVQNVFDHKQNIDFDSADAPGNDA